MPKSEMASRTSTKSLEGNGRPTQEEIAVRAHQIFEQRGSEPGHEVEDWLQAERELSPNGDN